MSRAQSIRIGRFRIRRSVVSAYATDMLGSALFLLMAEKNIRKVTIDELAARAGVGRATYFRNFSSKEELLTAYLVRQWRAY